MTTRTASTLWSIFDLDSRAVEICTGFIMMAMAVALALDGWFGGWIPSLAPLHGFEPAIGLIWFLYGACHAYAATTDKYRSRCMFALLAAFGLSSLSASAIDANGFLEGPGASAFAAASMIQVWAYASIKASWLRSHSEL